MACLNGLLNSKNLGRMATFPMDRSGKHAMDVPKNKFPEGCLTEKVARTEYGPALMSGRCVRLGTFRILAYCVEGMRSPCLNMLHERPMYRMKLR